MLAGKLTHFALGLYCLITLCHAFAKLLVLKAHLATSNNRNTSITDIWYIIVFKKSFKFFEPMVVLWYDIGGDFALLHFLSIFWELLECIVFLKKISSIVQWYHRS